MSDPHADRPSDATGQPADPPPAPPPAPSGRRLAPFVGVPLLLLLAWGGLSHWRESHAAADTLRQARAQAPDVQVQQARLGSDSNAVSLPGQTLAFASADLFARATGYVAERRVDIGSHVKQGDLLLRIAAPDLDQQLAQGRAQLGQIEAQLVQAKASLDQARASAKLAKVTSARSSILAQEGWETRQNRDNNATNYVNSTHNVASAEAGIGVAVANVRAQQATVDRLVALAAFERVVAPFDGVITQRQVDIGTLVQSDANSGTPLLHIDQTDKLRCQVYVPQSQFAGIHDGLAARVTVPELPGRVFKATVSRSAAALAQNSRSMLVEVDIDNTDGTLAPGLFVDVSFVVQREAPRIVVPDASLIFDESGMRVAVVKDGHAHLQHVTIARDTGTEADLSDGLHGGEQVIVNPPATLADGDAVHVLPEQKTKS